MSQRQRLKMDNSKETVVNVLRIIASIAGIIALIMIWTTEKVNNQNQLNISFEMVAFIVAIGLIVFMMIMIFVVILTKNERV